MMEDRRDISCCALSELPITLRVRDLQEILGISRSAAYKLIHSGRIRYIPIGRRILIPRAELIQFLSNSAT